MKKKTNCTILLVVGIILGLGPLWGLLGTVVGMMMAFNRMGEAGMGNPEALAGDIAISLYTTAIGIIMCPFGAACIIMSVVFKKRLEKETQNPNQEFQPPPIPLGSSVSEPVEGA